MNRSENVTPDLTQLCQRLEEWHQQGSGCRRIPEHLWKEALALVRTEGISRVSRILRLHYHRLKDRSKGALVPTVPEAPPAFVELPLAYSLAEGRECLVEMTHCSGARMRIHLPRASLGQLFRNKPTT